MRTVGLLLLIWSSLLAVPLAAQQVPQSAQQMHLSFVPLVRQATPAVVNIYAQVLRETRRSPFQGDPFFDRFFDGFGTPEPRVQNSLGSGVILSADGIVVSNYHVVGMATDIRVVLADRREYTARVLLGDAESDLAILQIEGAEDLPFLPLRASDTVEVGELVLAIGNPFGVGQTVSSGIVSGLARSGAATGSGRGYFIQTDAPINPGNSGGALIDVTGALIGINTSILTRSGGSNGIGFAIPADLVAAFVAQAREGRARFERPWAGMGGQPVDAEMAEAFGLARPGGIVISAMHPDSPFAQAGVAVGDVIVAVNGQPVNTPPEMVYRMSVIGLGRQAQISYLRAGAAQQTEVRLMPAPDVPDREPLTLERGDILPGLELARVNPAVIAEFNLPLESAGVIVTDTGRFGSRVGLRVGDVIVGVNDRAVQRPRDVVEAFRSRSRSYAVTVIRGAQRVVLRFGV
ncbi:trypsin-like peptidase domain-containing protein [Roseobacter sinensis]|uniref:Trypsin-like peptidase domain-containing protein n=1 Tax=Roseobacter sinensis TaxID=2931391 RepID=A0ABT3BJG9_9RHOB|nr:trypsin-like peptidase domain-containing protein [Roseobacter sp. WL0113]MCV3273722.1 trypsin-like peptidase domain-containing protein [Roseobacter sp. WL0113]